MEGSIANQDEAEKCRDLAKSFMTKGEYSKASKFFEKSLKLFVLPGVTALKQKADQLASQQQGGGSSSSRGSASGAQSDSSTAASSGTPSSGGSRSYTPEQESGAKKILTLSKKSHYEVSCRGVEVSLLQCCCCCCCWFSLILIFILCCRC